MRNFSLTIAVITLLASFLFPTEVIFGQEKTETLELLNKLPDAANNIKDLIQKADESVDLTEEQKKQVKAFSDQALEDLKRVSKNLEASAQYSKDAQNIDQRVRELKKKIETLKDEKPPSVENLEINELEQEISKKEIQLTNLKAELARVEAEVASRINRRRDIRKLLVDLSGKIPESRKQIDQQTKDEKNALLAQAEQFQLTAKHDFYVSSQTALQNELAKYDAEDANDFLSLSRDALNLEINFVSKEVDQLQNVLNQKRAEDSAAFVQKAKSELNSVPEDLKPFAEFNVSLAEKAHALSQPIKKAEEQVEKTNSLLETIQKQFISIQQRVNDIGLTGSVGSLLRKQKTDLPNISNRKNNINDRKRLIEEYQYNVFEFDDLRSESIDDLVDEAIKSLKIKNKEELDQYREVLRKIFEQRRIYLDHAKKSYNLYLDILFDLDEKEQKLVIETEKYLAYINERVLWIKSNRPIWSHIELDASDKTVLSPNSWRNLGKFLYSDMKVYPFQYLLGFLIFVTLFWKKRTFRIELVKISEDAKKTWCNKYSLTMRALFLTFMMSFMLTSIVLLLSWRLGFSTKDKFILATSSSLFLFAFVYFPLNFTRLVCRRNGLAESHFDWSNSTVSVLRSNLKWLTIFGIPILLFGSLFYYMEEEHGYDFPERLLFIAGMMFLAFFSSRVFSPTHGIFREYLSHKKGSWLDRLKIIWYGLFVLIPVVLIFMTILGYYYTAQKILWQLFTTFVFLIAVQIVRGLLQRLILVQRRTISIQQAKARRAALAKSAESEGGETVQALANEDLQQDVATITEQSQRMIKIGVLIASFSGLWFIWVDVLPALKIMDEWTLWTTTVKTSAPVSDNVSSPADLITSGSESGGSSDVMAEQTIEVVKPVTVADVLLALLISILTFICARNIPGLMEILVLQRLPLDNSSRYAITTVSRYIIVLAGVILGFSAISIGWSKVQWLATALTFGLAFGLQEIFANFIAGLILLFEQPIRLGDVITVDDVSGVVSRIRIRATTITNWDHKEYVIPNKEFITGRMLNWTLSDRSHRLVINVGFAYGSDIEKAKTLLTDIAKNNPKVLKDPKPTVTFEGFGDNSLSFVVRAFVANLDDRWVVIDELHTTIDRECRLAGLEIAFPQRDLHLRSIDQSVLENFKPNKDQN